MIPLSNIHLCRPFCTRCRTLRTECTYEAEEGESRWSALRRRNQILETERSELHELVSYLQTRPESEAQEIFQRLRSGGPDDFFTLLRQLRESNASGSSQVVQPQRPPLLTHEHSSNSTSSNGSEHRLPPISTMFEVSGSYTPAPLTLPMIQSASGPQGPLSARSHSSRSQSSRSSHSSMDHPFRSGP